MKTKLLIIFEVCLWLLILCLMAVKPGHATIDFDGTYEAGDYVTCGTGDVMPEGADYSLYWRGRFDTFADDDAVLFFKVGAGGEGEAAVFRVNDPNGELNFWKEGATYMEVITSTQLSTGTEYVLIVTVAAGTTATGVHIYVNGTEASYAAQDNGATLVDSASGLLWMGANSGFADAFNGIIREAAIFNKILSAGEIASLSTRPVRNVPLDIGAVRYWKFIDGTAGTSADGDTIADFYGSGNCTGDDGANNTGLTWGGEDVVKEQPVLSN